MQSEQKHLDNITKHTIREMLTNDLGLNRRELTARVEHEYRDLADQSIEKGINAAMASINVEAIATKIIRAHIEEFISWQVKSAMLEKAKNYITNTRIVFEDKP